MGSIINCFSYWFHFNVLRWVRTYIIMGRSIVSKPKMCLEYFLNIFKYLLYLFVSVFDQLSLKLFCPTIQPRIFFFKCNCCNTKKAWVRGRKMGLPSSPFNEKIPRNVGTRWKCLANGTGHAESGCVPECSQWFPLFVTTPLWGTRPLPPSQQLWETQGCCCGQANAQSPFLSRTVCLLAEEGACGKRGLTFPCLASLDCHLQEAALRVSLRLSIGHLTQPLRLAPKGIPHDTWIRYQ